jgi:hypothetical protein
MTSHIDKTKPLPDRVSIVKDSPNYSPFNKHIGVKFNGKVVTNVVEYCVSEGWCLLIALTDKGKHRIERGRYVTVKVSGTVEPYWR